MFQNDPYMTVGFNAELSDQLKWTLVNRIKGLNKADYPVDYLQVFDLEKDMIKGHYVQKITHHQSEPKHIETHYLILPDDEIITGKVFVVDENDHHMFMLASEH